MLEEQEDTQKKRLCMHNTHTNQFQWSTPAPDTVPFPGDWAEPSLQEEWGNLSPNIQYIVMEWYEETVLLGVWTCWPRHVNLLSNSAEKTVRK